MPPIRRLSAASVLVAALAVSGCAATTSAADSDAFTIVTSTTVYAQIAEAIAGDAAAVTPIIASASRDPHEYEATAADRLTVAEADLVIMNGGGYDAFVETLIDDTDSDVPVLVAVDSSTHIVGSHEHEEDDDHEHGDHDHDAHDHDHSVNEHVWYDPQAMGAFAAAIAAALTTALPDDADDFRTRLDAFTLGIIDLEQQLTAIDTAHSGEQVLATEPVAGYLIEAAGLVDATPSAFSEAVEEGQDVPPAVLLDMLGLIGDGETRVLIANAQTGGAETTEAIAAAENAGVPVLEFTESLPDGTTYLEWMSQNVKDLAGALE